jgi:hypothetical protein
MYVKETREYDMNNPEYKENPELSFDEIGKIINKLKLNKASGIDNIPNFVLKKHDVMILLYNLFKKCFEYSILPTVWLKSVITPIPKSSSKDPFVPINYRGISLLSCVCKVFSGVINKRIIDYCEIGNIFVDEQNGFRRDRSCCDHIYSLNYY